MTQLAQMVPRASPKFTNAGKLLIDGDCKEELQFVRVLNKTANIVNGPVLLRRHVDTPDGFYDINIDGSLSSADYHYGLRYPDVETVKPPFKKMSPSCLIDSKDLGPMIAMADEIFKARGTVVIDKTTMHCHENNNIGITYPFGLTFPIRVNPRYLSIILVEMHQYPQVKVLREMPASHHNVEPEDVTTPLLIGVDWGSCGLLMPYRGYYG